MLAEWIIVVLLAVSVWLLLRGSLAIRRYVAVGVATFMTLVLFIVITVVWNRSQLAGQKRDIQFCSGNLTKLWNATLKYRRTHAGSLPDTLSDLVETSPRVLLCRAVQGRSDLNATSLTTYAYHPTVDPLAVMTYCPPANHGNKGGNVLFGDGSVRFYQKSEFDQIIKVGHRGTNSTPVNANAIDQATSTKESTMSLYDISFNTSTGTATSLGAYKGKVVMIVNVASKCGFTPQYTGLEALYQKHKDAGLVVLGFPCNQFGFQEPGTDAEIQSFCSLNYKVTFPVMSKIDVNGTNAHPLYEAIKASAPGVLGSEAIKWNFTKFLIGRDGKVIQRYAPTNTPESLEADITKALAAK